MAYEYHTHTAPLAEPLTAREREILSLVGQQRTNRQIAGELVLAHSTVRWYLRQLYAKLGVAGRKEAIARAQALGLAASPASTTTNSHNLPTATTPFVGRQVELQELGDLLLDSHVRLLTILGPGGMGKTRLALSVAEQQVSRLVPGSDQLLFPEGVWFAPLAAVESTPHVVTAIADALHLELQAPSERGRSPQQQVTGFLRRKQLLLVLDNFEHLHKAASFLAQLMAEAPGIKVLVSSRQPLQLQGENLFWVDGLELPEEDTRASAARSDAVRLFASTARRVKPAFTLDEPALAPVARICRLLEGMPLAVELAASWIGVLRPEAIEQEVRSGLGILASELRDVPPRHRSMQNTLDLSWRRMDPGEQDVFRQLSAFRGGLTREAARLVAGATLPCLGKLTNASWLTYDPTQDRYQVHELLRQFGEGQLRKDPDLEKAARTRHAAYFVAFLHQRENGWYGDKQKQLFEETRREVDNVLHAWKWAVHQGEIRLIADALEGLCAYYERDGDHREAGELLRAASDSLSSSPPRTRNNVERCRLLVRLHVWRARFAPSVAEGRVAVDQGEVVLDDLRRQQVDARREEGLLALRRGQTELGVNRFASRRYLRRALSLYTGLSDSTGKARSATALGVIEWNLGHYDAAAEFVQQGLDGHRAVGNRSGVADGLSLLGLIEKHRGRLIEAAQAHGEGYSLLRALGDRSRTVRMAGTLASTLLWRGDFAQARATALEGLELADEVGAQGLTAYVASVTAWACIHLGRYDEVQKHKYTDRALTLARVRDEQQTLGFALMHLGKLSLATGSYKEAVGQFEEAAVVLARLKKSIGMMPLVINAFALRRVGEPSRARRTLAKALRQNMNPGVFFVVINALPAAAQLIADSGNIQRAVELYTLALRYPYIANSRWFRDIAGEEVEERAASLPPDVVEAARQRGRTRDLWATAEELVAQFSNQTAW